MSGTGWPGRYQHALAKLEHAARHWVSKKEGACCAINIGDLTAGNESKVRPGRGGEIPRGVGR